MERVGVADALIIGAFAAAELLVAIMFVIRVRHARSANRWGLAGLAMALPMLGGMIVNAASNAPLADTLLPLAFIVFAVVTVGLDEIWKTDFRSTRALGPYLVLFYVAQFMLIGYAFRAGAAWGVAALASYFVCLGATAYSYRKVGHDVHTREPAGV